MKSEPQSLMSEQLRPARVPSPGAVLRRELDARGWSQADLARVTGRPTQAINEIAQGKKEITPEGVRDDATVLVVRQAVGQ